MTCRQLAAFSNTVRGRAAGALLAAVLATLAVALAVHEPPFGFGRLWPFFVTALPGMALATLTFRGVSDREFRHRGTGTAQLPQRGRELRLGRAAVALGGALVLGAMAGFILSDGAYRYQWLAWIAGAMLVLLGFYLMDQRVSGAYARVREGFQVRVDAVVLARWGALAAVLAAAAAVRVVGLDTQPAGLELDERYHLQRALEYWNTSLPVPPYDDHVTVPPAYMMMVWAFSEVIGVSEVTPRLVSALLGVAGVAAVYLMGRRIMGAPLGIMAAAILAALAWDINLSRFGVEIIAAPFCAALAVWATLRAMSEGRNSDYALAGVALASGYWFYEAYYAFFLLVGAMLVYGYLRSRPELRRRVLGGAVTLALLTAVWVAPIAAYAADEPGNFLKRGRQTSVFDGRPLGECLEDMVANAGFNLRMFHFQGDLHPLHNLPGRPMLDHVSGALLLLGTALAAARWRRAGLAVLPAWLLMMMLTGIVSEGASHTAARRSVTILPAVALLAALPLALSWRSVASWALWPRAVVRGATAAALALVAFFGVGQYFGAQAGDPGVYAVFNTEVTLLARDVVGPLEEGYAIGVSPVWATNENARLLTVWPRPTLLESPGSIPVDPLAIGDRAGIAVYVHRDARDDLAALQRFYPNSETKTETTPDGTGVMYHRVSIGRRDLWAASGLTADGSGSALRETAMLHAHAPGTYRGFLHVREQGEHEFILRGGGSVSVSIDGREIESGGDWETRVRSELGAGLHVMVVTLAKDTTLGSELLWRTPTTEAFVPIGASHLFRSELAR